MPYPLDGYFPDCICTTDKNKKEVESKHRKERHCPSKKC